MLVSDRDDRVELGYLTKTGGWFSLATFRDGEQLYPIKAVAADGEQERSIRLEFERRTPQARVNRKEDAVLEWF